jgi:hypothetical protein
MLEDPFKANTAEKVTYHQMYSNNAIQKNLLDAFIFYGTLM